MEQTGSGVQCHGVDLPASPFLTEALVRQIEGGCYAAEEIAGALAVVRTGDRVLQIGADPLGVLSAVILRQRQPSAMLTVEANPARARYLRSLHCLNGLGDRIELRHHRLTGALDQSDGEPGDMPTSLDHPVCPETVPTTAFARVVRHFQPDVLLIAQTDDATDLLLHTTLKDVRAVVIAVSPTDRAPAGTKACKDKLHALGFRQVNAVSSRSVWTCTRAVQRLTPPNPAGGWSMQIARLKRPVVVPPRTRSHVQPSGVLTAEGLFVPHAATWRNGRLLTPPPEPPKEVVRLPGRWLWGGVLWRYFPHFITESVTRLWALEHLDQAEFDGLLFSPKSPGNTERQPGFQRDFLALMGCTLPIHEAQTACVPDELIVPGQGFGLGQISRGTDRFIEAMALRFGQDIAPEGSEKLYISRSKLGPNRGALLGEERLEAHLTAEGYEIFHPQAHSLEAQVARYKAARLVVAAEGSALHLFAFVGRPDQRVAMILRRKSGATRHISTHLESFAGRAPLWIETLRRSWMPVGEVRKRLAIGEPDFAAVQAALVSGGFVAPGPVWPQPGESEVQATLGAGFALLNEGIRLVG
jgi:hypothetical protein